MKKCLTVGGVKNVAAAVKNPVKEKYDDVGGMMSKTIYNNYAKSMKELNIKRGKMGRDQIHVRTFQEWRGEE